MAIKKEKNKHLTDDQRLAPEAALRGRRSLSQIRRETGIPRSTIKRETVNRRVESTKTFYGRRFNPCVHRGGCQAPGMCGRPDCTRRCAGRGLRCREGSCPRFEEERRHRLAVRLQRMPGRAEAPPAQVPLPAQARARGVPQDARGVQAGRQRHRGRAQGHRQGRPWGPFQDFPAENPGVQVPESDTVEGGRRDKCVLPTAMFARQGFIFARPMPGKCARHVADAFNWMWRALGDAAFRMLFPAVLADNGTEPSNPLAIGTSPGDGTRRTRVSCTRPYTATDKAHVERNHEYVRRVAFRGEGFDRLTQGQVDLMMSHVNGYARASLMDDDSHPCRTPYERFAFEYGEEIARRLGIVPIPLREVTLRPELLEVR